VTPAERRTVVLDASAVVHGLLGSSLSAVDVVNRVARATVVAHAPDLLVAEVTNALRVRISERWPVEAARECLVTFLGLGITIHGGSRLAPTALSLAASRGLSAYDAFYAVLSDALEAPLYTSDHRLAAAVRDSVLVV
jgi:predicted nucleic acid-binding protein